jgi:hypothetical protein
MDCVQHGQPSNVATSAKNEIIDAMQHLPQRTDVSATFNGVPPLKDSSYDKILVDELIPANLVAGQMSRLAQLHITELRRAYTLACAYGVDGCGGNGGGICYHVLSSRCPWKRMADS